jgi:hypothetical protein
LRMQGARRGDGKRDGAAKDGQTASWMGVHGRAEGWSGKGV